MTIPKANQRTYEVHPIGVIRTPWQDKASAPRQPPLAAEAKGTVELHEGQGFEDALDGLEAFDTIWLLFPFDRNWGAPFKPKVRPPRSAEKRGVFATRAPHRPNSIGMSAVRLDGIEGLTLHVTGVDMLDETPLFDIKPYVPYCDSFPDASSGWLATAEDPGPRYDVQWSALAEQQGHWLEERGIDLRGPTTTLLATGPAPHAYRRISRLPDGSLRLAYKAWRIRFTTEDRSVVVERVTSGYRARDLDEGKGPADDVVLHRAFVSEFGA